MRIALLTDVYVPFVSGVTHAVALLAGALRRHGHEASVFTSGQPEPEDVAEGVFRHPGVTLGHTGYSVLLSYPPAWRALLREMDVLHIHHPFGSGRLAIRYASRLPIPLVYTNHTRYDLYAKLYAPWPLSWVAPELARRYLRRFARRMDAVIAPAPSLRRRLEEWGVRVPVDVVPNGVDLTLLREAKPADRTALELPPDAAVLVFVGRLGEEKNLRFLLRAFIHLAGRDRRAHLLLVGDGPERGPLEGMARAGGLERRVHFSGKIPRERVPSHLALGDVFVTSSVTEVHPLALLEAIGAGLPVVGVRAPGVEDIVVHNVNGLLCDGDPEAMAGTLARLLQEPHRLRALAQGAARSAAEYSIESTVRRTLEIYSRCLAGRRRDVGLWASKVEQQREERS